MLHVRKTESGGYEIEEDGAPGFERWPPSSFPPGTFEWQRPAPRGLPDIGIDPDLVLGAWKLPAIDGVVIPAQLEADWIPTTETMTAFEMGGTVSLRANEPSAPSLTGFQFSVVSLPLEDQFAVVAPKPKPVRYPTTLRGWRKHINRVQKQRWRRLGYRLNEVHAIRAARRKAGIRDEVKTGADFTKEERDRRAAAIDNVTRSNERAYTQLAQDFGVSREIVPFNAEVFALHDQEPTEADISDLERRMVESLKPARIEAAAKRMRYTGALRGPSLPVMTHALRIQTHRPNVPPAEAIPQNYPELEPTIAIHPELARDTGRRCPFCGGNVGFDLAGPDTPPPYKMLEHGSYIGDRRVDCIASLKTLDEARALRELHDVERHAATARKHIARLRDLPDAKREEEIADALKLLPSEMRCPWCGGLCLGDCRE